ncbi:MAG TPA: hypothetical protein VIL71_14045 [Spirillospora sp.]
MSDQGERGVRWTEMNESEPRDESREEPRAGEATGPQAAFPEPKVPSFGGDSAGRPHDVWGKVEQPRSWEEPAGEPTDGEQSEARAESRTGARAGTDAGTRAEGAEDVRVAPVRTESPQWEGDLFDEGDGDDRYAPAVPTGSGRPAKPGKPSSGNWQMPEWMADEDSADAKLGDGASRDALDGGGGRASLVLFGGIGLLVVALIVAAVVYLLKDGGGEPVDSGDNAGRAAERSEAPRVELPPDKKLVTFTGRPSRVSGQVSDTHSGLSYPRMAAPWKVPTKRNRLGTPGWSGQQILVTENNGGQLWYGQLLTGTLHPTMQAAYQGPDSVKNATAVAAQGYEAQYYAFPHETKPLASQALNVGGRPGWLIASYLTYKREGVKATGEVVATAVIDTGRATPAVVFASMPNTHRQMWPDVNTFFSRLKIAS